jgi:uncharacterized membrane protein
MNEKLSKHFGLILVLILCSLPLIGLLQPGLPVTHDGIDHVARIANFYKGLTEGILFPRWAQNLNWGYGHPILMFLYPFSSYFASLFHLVGFSFVDSLKLIFGIGYIASGVTMYVWAKKQFNDYFGIAASLLYVYAPYRFIDLYVRGAIGEHMAFIFPPLILYFIYQYFNNKKIPLKSFSFIGISLSFALFLLAHNAISLMFIPFIICYSLILSYQRKNYKECLYVFLAICNGFLLSSFFTVPAFLEGKFTLRDIVTGDEYKNRFVTNPLSFIYGVWSYGITGQFSVQIGIAHILGILILPFVYLKTNKEFKILLITLFVFFVGAIFLMVPQSNFIYQTITTLQKFQFPWRFLSLTVFTSSLLGSGLFLVIKNSKAKKIMLLILILILLGSTLTYWKAKGYTRISDSFFENVYNGTTDTGESSPIWSVRFMEKRPKAHTEVITGEAQIKEQLRKSTLHKYSIKVESNEARIRENTLYFPNWKVIVDGREQNIQFQDPTERGLITYTLSKGVHNVLVKFEDTKLRMVSNIVSLISLIATIVVGFTILKKNEK